MPLVEHAPCSRRREPDEVRNRARPSFLREADECEQHLGRSLRVRQGPVTGLHRCAEEVGELAETRAGHPSCQQPPGKRHRVDDGRCEPRACQALGLAIQEGEIEARVVRDEHRIAGEGEEVAHRGGRRRRAAQLPIREPGERRDRSGERNVWVDEGLEQVDDLETGDLGRADLADVRCARPQAGRLEVDDDVCRVFEQEVGAERAREPNGVAAPGEARVGLDNVSEERSRECDGCLPQCEQPARRLVGDDRSAPFLDELDEAVGGVQSELHG